MQWFKEVRNASLSHMILCQLWALSVPQDPEESILLSHWCSATINMLPLSLPHHFTATSCVLANRKRTENVEEPMPGRHTWHFCHIPLLRMSHLP
jgi:hypothetical protein